MGLPAAATLLTAAPALVQVQFDVGPGGVRIGPRYHDEDARFYHRGWRYGYRGDDCRERGHSFLRQTVAANIEEKT